MNQIDEDVYIHMSYELVYYTSLNKYIYGYSRTPTNMYVLKTSLHDILFARENSDIQKNYLSRLPITLDRTLPAIHATAK